MNLQRNFSEVMLFERCLCSRRLLEWKYAMNMHFERACLNQFVQSVDSLTATLAIVGIDAHVGGRLRFRPHAVWICDASISTDRSQRSISRVTTSGDECGV